MSLIQELQVFLLFACKLRLYRYVRIKILRFISTERAIEVEILITINVFVFFFYLCFSIVGVDVEISEITFKSDTHFSDIISNPNHVRMLWLLLMKLDLTCISTMSSLLIA